MNYVEVSALTEGSYELWLKKEDVRININVYSGDYWNNSLDFIIQERGIIERKNTKIDSLRIDKLEIKNTEVEEEEG